MYLCLDCGELFEVPYKYTEKHGLDPPYETVTCCPVCNGDYVKTFRCDECGEWIDTNTYYKVGDKVYCNECCVAYVL